MVDDVPVPQILTEIVEVGKPKKVARERISERICEQIVDATVSHSQPQILKEVVEVVKAVNNVPQERTSEKIGEQIDDDIVPVDERGDQACRGHATSSCGRAFDQADQPGDQARRVSADCGDTVTGPSRSSADGPQPSSVEEQLLRMAMLIRRCREGRADEAALRLHPTPGCTTAVRVCARLVARFVGKARLFRFHIQVIKVIEDRERRQEKRGEGEGEGERDGERQR